MAKTYKTGVVGLLKKHKDKLLSVGIALFFLVVTLNIYKDQTQKIQALTQSRDTEIKKNEILAKISKSEKVLTTQKSFFAKKDISSVIQTINGIAKEYNIKISGMKPNAEIRTTVYTKYPFELTITADTYHSVGKFISKIENHPDRYFIDRMVMRYTAVGKESGIAADITFSTMVFKN